MAETSAPSTREAVSRLRDLIDLRAGESLQRAYLFEALDRRGTVFGLAFVTKSCADGRLEMVALGGRAEAGGRMGWDFIRRARFPPRTLPAVLEEFVERCGAEGASHRDVDLPPDPEHGLATLAEALAFDAGAGESRSQDGR